VAAHATCLESALASSFMGAPFHDENALEGLNRKRRQLSIQEYPRLSNRAHTFPLQQLACLSRASERTKTAIDMQKSQQRKASKCGAMPA
jgi:hypothetical protein